MGWVGKFCRTDIISLIKYHRRTCLFINKRDCLLSMELYVNVNVNVPLLTLTHGYQRPSKRFLVDSPSFRVSPIKGSKWLFNCSWKSFVVIYCMEREIICLLRRKRYIKMKAFCKEMETICFLSNISWNILIFFYRHNDISEQTILFVTSFCRKF